MDPITIGFALFSAFGQLGAGQATKNQADQTADQMALDRELRAIQSKQWAAARIDDYLVASSANNAFFAYSGRDTSDRSIKAFKEKQAEIVQTDIERSDNQSMLEQSRMKTQEVAERARGRNAVSTSIFNAFSTVSTGAYRAQQVYVP